jgi:predicted dehydrogenase
MNAESEPHSPNRRRFLKTSSAAVVGGALASSLQFPSVTLGAPNSRKLKVGLVGCGGRGTGAAAQAMKADSNVELWALGDAFEDQLTKSEKNLAKQFEKEPDKLSVVNRKFVGWDAIDRVIDAGPDVVLIATPPHFRPQHLRKVVEAGRHCFAEKPVAVDAPGVRSVLETAELAKKKGVSIVSGLCWRYEIGMQEVMKRIHDGAIGDIVSLESTRYTRGVGKLAERQPGWTDMVYQMRNWYYYTWLSGDFIAEQFVHELDKMAWLMKGEYPTSCIASGGRIARTERKYGHVYDHFNAHFDYANGVKYYASTRHEPNTDGIWRDHAHGTNGWCDLMNYTLYDKNGKPTERVAKKRTDMHQLEHNEMYASLRRGEMINNGEYMAKSTMMAIMARMSAYTGKALTWEQAINSKEDLSPPSYDWDQPLPEPPVAKPGVTQFI